MQGCPVTRLPLHSSHTPNPGLSLHTTPANPGPSLNAQHPLTHGPCWALNACSHPHTAALCPLTHDHAVHSASLTHAHTAHFANGHHATSWECRMERRTSVCFGEGMFGFLTLPSPRLRRGWGTRRLQMLARAARGGDRALGTQPHSLAADRGSLRKSWGTGRTGQALSPQDKAGAPHVAGREPGGLPVFSTNPGRAELEVMWEPASLWVRPERGQAL